MAPQRVSQQAVQVPNVVDAALHRVVVVKYHQTHTQTREEGCESSSMEDDEVKSIERKLLTWPR